MSVFLDLRTVAIFCVLALDGCTVAITRNDCLSAKEWTIDPSTKEALEWKALAKPPMSAARMISNDDVVAALSSAEPHQVVWYEGPRNHNLLIVAWTNGDSESFEFDHIADTYPIVSHSFSICAG